MSGSQECRRVIFQGRVQGVGFRYTTSRLARRFPVTGFVRNLADGTVELMVRGEPGNIREFVDAVSETFAANIQAMDESSEPDQEFDGFRIR